MKRCMKILFLSALALCMGSTQAFACGIEGKATRSDGSKVDGTVTVSTSWNSNKAYPRNGYYNLELGSNACGRNVEVYVNGNSIGNRKIPNDGNARVDFVMRGSSNMPVR